MAFDKVVDSEALDTELKNLADILREKSGTAEELDFYAGDFSRVAESIEFIGVKYSNFDDTRMLPRTADARSFDLILSAPNIKYYTANDSALTHLFANENGNGNGGYNVYLEEVYLPSKVTALTNTFGYCVNLKKIYGTLPYVYEIGNAFRDCRVLEEIPYMPKLRTINHNSFLNCYKLKKYSLPPTIKTIHSSAFTGCENLLDIYCPWAEGAVANAPWGATNATIHYNTTYDENGNPTTE